MRKADERCRQRAGLRHGRWGLHTKVLTADYADYADFWDALESAQSAKSAVQQTFTHFQGLLVLWRRMLFSFLQAEPRFYQLLTHFGRLFRHFTLYDALPVFQKMRMVGCEALVVFDNAILVLQNAFMVVQNAFVVLQNAIMVLHKMPPVLHKTKLFHKNALLFLADALTVHQASCRVV